MAVKRKLFAAASLLSFGVNLPLGLIESPLGKSRIERWDTRHHRMARVPDHLSFRFDKARALPASANPIAPEEEIDAVVEQVPEVHQH